MKGVHAFISATILILVTVVVATMVSSWTVNVSNDRANTILNATRTKLNCQYSGFLVTNVTYDCNNECFGGSPYRINATIENTGSSKVLIEDMFVSLSNGLSYAIDGNLTSISAGDVVTKLFNAVLVRTNPKMPTETMDTRNEYVNGTNTNLLCHFESTPTCIARTDGAGNANGVSYESGKFNSAVKINETDTLKYNATANINASQGAIEFWVAPNWSADNTRKSFVSIAGVDVNVTAEWKFEDEYYNISKKNVTDTSGNSNNGTFTGETFNSATLSGASWNSSGRHGGAMTFDGINDMINVTPAANLNISVGGSLTMEAWFNLMSTAGTNWILAKGNATNGYGISYENGPMCYVNSTAANATGNATINANTWYHFGCTFSGSQITIYIDSLRRANASYANGVPNNSQPLIIGSRSLMDSFFNGSIDEVRIYNRALTQGEIQEDMNSAYPMNRTVASYSFEEGGGNTAYDTHNRVAGQWGAALSFDGTDDYVSFPGVLNTAGTAELWVKWLRGSVGYGAQDFIADFIWQHSANNYFYTRTWSGAYSYFSYVIPLDTWTHLVFTWTDSSDLSTSKLYANTVPYDPNPGAGGYGSIAGLSGLAHGGSWGGNYLNALIDEVRVYNRALTVEEINASYHAGLGSGFAKDNDMLVFKWGSNATMANISSWSANAWHHVAGTWDSSFAKLYTDGNLQSTARSVLPASINDTLYVGSHSTGTKQANAWFDELRVSNATRNFTVTLIANVTYPDISTVRIFDHANALMNTSGTLSSAPTYNVSLNLSASAEYRVEVTDTAGNRIEKWYPFRPGGSCVATSQLETVKFTAMNCPETTDTYQGTDVTFANCA